MKNRTKLFLIVLFVALMSMCVIVLSACGESAYDIAVKNGFEGTEQEWLESLKGEKGDQGERGEKGDQGVQGEKGDVQSAYDIAVENGFEGTVEEWLESLKGEKGDQGNPGQNGESFSNAELTFDAEGRLLIGGLDSGLTLEDTTQIGFMQLNETLDGVLSISVLNPNNFFDYIKLSIYREGAVIDEVEYIDYIIEEALLDDNYSFAQLTAPYYGQYTVKVIYEKDNAVFGIRTKDIAFTASHYNFVYSNSTMPVLYAAATMVQLDHTYPTYVAIHRSGTFDWNNLPENTYGIPNSSYGVGTTKLALYNEAGQEKTCQYGTLIDGSWGALYVSSGAITPALKQMKYWIGELYNLDQSSTFSFYNDDTIHAVVLWWTYGNNMDASRFDITMYTEGSSTTTKFVKYFSSKALYDESAAVYNEFMADLLAGKDITSIWVSRLQASMAMQSNVTYIINTKSSILSSMNSGDTDYVKMISDKLNQFTIAEALQAVEDAGKLSELQFLLRTKWIDSDGEIGDANSYFATDNGKKNLLIIGTSVSGENNSNGCGANTTLMTFMEYIVAKYSGEYNIFYKGHPSYTINAFSDGRAAYFAQHNIVVLPNAVPAETYMYLYDEVYIGGYYSSTMASSKIGQTLFFIGQESLIKAQSATASMFDKTADDYLGVFENTEFFTIDSISA